MRWIPLQSRPAYGVLASWPRSAGRLCTRGLVRSSAVERKLVVTHCSSFYTYNVQRRCQTAWIEKAGSRQAVIMLALKLAVLTLAMLACSV